MRVNASKGDAGKVTRIIGHEIIMPNSPIYVKIKPSARSISGV
jgi:hypothetical protein